MDINADFQALAVVHSAEQEWVNSPMPGVLRRPLERVGDEVARATSVVRYAPASQFSAHRHDGGEEFLVLEGVFQDEHGDYPAGSYVRNPPGTSHTPGSQTGCTILVKLWQFDPSDTQQIRLVSASASIGSESPASATSHNQLFENEFESVSIQYWRAGFTQTFAWPDGIELFVLDGELQVNGHCLREASWIRLPCGTQLEVIVGGSDAKVWVKSGHLRQVTAQLARLAHANS
ncbi:cupin domain-containing protein [Arenicella xantha]|uniref:ChrR-like anti-ECFsigma factor n=1 Tax=Arenicella xantha TaxID=644221 RepID=A0A395JPL1_9GAMM|nr:cupin domain-containing protein [Arenicella xantha]RBP51737.1 ChrR-like anti-ECFsigma factor [Arenicella xantha]